MTAPTNLFKQLQALLPPPPLQVATVAAVHADATCTVVFPGGGQARMRGTGAPGSKVFVRNGVVEGSAPDLITTVIEV